LAFRCPAFEGDERDLRLATRTEPERDSWIERLHIAGFECLRIQLQSLREQLKARTGRDPIKLGGLAVDGLGTADSVSGKNVYDRRVMLFFEFIIKYCMASQITYLVLRTSMHITSVQQIVTIGTVGTIIMSKSLQH